MAPVASAAGNRAWSVSMAAWAGVPGMEKLVEVGPESVAAATLDADEDQDPEAQHRAAVEEGRPAEPVEERESASLEGSQAA